MRTDVQRDDKYQAKYVAATVNLKVAARLDSMKARYALRCAGIYQLETQVQLILNGTTPAPLTTLFPFYLAFGREMWYLKERGFTGAVLNAAAQVYHDKWEATGLTSAVLIDIALNTVGAVVT